MSDQDSTHDSGARKTIINKPLDWANTFFLSEAAKTLRFAKDSDGNLWALPVVLCDPTNAGSNILAMGKTSLADPILPNSYARIYGNPDTGVLASAFTSILAQAAKMMYKPSTLQMEVQRTPDTFKVATFTGAGGTVWDPAAGKKARVMGGCIVLSKEAACAGAFQPELRDSATAFFYAYISQAALVATGNVVVIPIVFPGNGYLSLVADNNISISYGNNLTAGCICVSLWGTEE